MAALRERALRLLPHVGIGVAPPGGVTLVNVDTLLWADTATQRSLGTVSVVGRAVALRIRLDGADWNFGDGETDTTADPGKPYDEASDPCHTAHCPDYYSHAYQRTGHVTITLTLRWRAEFSVDGGGTWTAVDPDPLAGPRSRQQITVKQARGVLVPNPGDH